MHLFTCRCYRLDSTKSLINASPRQSVYGGSHFEILAALFSFTESDLPIFLCWPPDARWEAYVIPSDVGVDGCRVLHD